MKIRSLLAAVILSCAFVVAEPIMHLEQRGNAVQCWVEDWGGGQAVAIYEPNTLVKAHYGAEYMDPDRRWLWRQGNAKSVIQLRSSFVDGQLFTVTARGYTTVSASVTLEKEPAIPEERYVTIKNVRFDLQYCGGIDRLIIDGVNLVDASDNGRLIQVDAGTGEPCCSSNPWPNIPHRRIETPTQGGGYQQEPNWPIEWEVEGDTFRAKCRMIDYWSTDSRVTDYVLDYEVTVGDEGLHIQASIEPEVRLTTIWFFNKATQVMPDYERWDVDQAFVLTPHIDMDGVVFGGATDKMVMAWPDRDTGSLILQRTKPEEADSLMTAVRYFDSSEASAFITFPADEPILDPNQVDRIEAILRATLRILTEDGIVDPERFYKYYNEELEGN